MEHPIDSEIEEDDEEEEIEEEDEERYLLMSQEISFHASRGTYSVKIKLSRHCEYMQIKEIDASLHYEDKRIGDLSGTILPRPSRIFYEMADADSGELQTLACMFCDKNGRATRIETGMPTADVYQGGFFHIEQINVDQAHMGQDLGLLMLHHLLCYIKDYWKLAVLEAVPEVNRLCNEKYTDTPMSHEEFAEAKDKLQRHYARMGFQQAGRDCGTCDYWFLTAFNYFQDNTKESINWKSREEVQDLDIYVSPPRHHPQGQDLELQKLVQEHAPLNQITAIVRRGASIHSSRALFILAANNVEVSPTLEALIGLGNVNEADETGCRPLHIAATRVNATMIRFLLSAGADKSVRNDKGETPMDCLESHMQDIADFSETMGLKMARAMDVDPFWESAMALMPANLSSTLIDGWLSPRMMYALQCTAETELMMIEEETARIFTKYQPTSLSDCCSFYPGFRRIEYIPTEVLQRNSQGFYKSFADGWEIVWKAILVTLQRNQAPTISRVRQVICCGDYMYDLRKFSHFVDKGGKIDFAIDGLLQITKNVVIDGDDGWEYWMEEEKIEALPVTPFDKAFDLAKVKCLEITNRNFRTQPAGPYYHKFVYDGMGD